MINKSDKFGKHLEFVVKTYRSALKENSVRCSTPCMSRTLQTSRFLPKILAVPIKDVTIVKNNGQRLIQILNSSISNRRYVANVYKPQNNLLCRCQVSKNTQRHLHRIHFVNFRLNVNYKNISKLWLSFCPLRIHFQNSLIFTAWLVSDNSVPTKQWSFQVIPFIVYFLQMSLVIDLRGK